MRVTCVPSHLHRARQSRACASASPPTSVARAELLHVDFDRVDAIGAYWDPDTRAFAELLIDCEEDRTLRAVLVGMPREADEKRRQARG